MDAFLSLFVEKQELRKMKPKILGISRHCISSIQQGTLRLIFLFKFICIIQFSKSMAIYFLQRQKRISTLAFFYLFVWIEPMSFHKVPNYYIHLKILANYFLYFCKLFWGQTYFYQFGNISLVWLTNWPANTFL